MRRSGRWFVAAVAAWAAIGPAAGAPAPRAGPPVQARERPTPAGAAWLLVDARTGRRVGVSEPAVIETPMAPGSIAKVATLVAALEAGVVRSGTTLACRRSVTVDGRTITCSHPVIGRPLSLPEALAHSCNYAFASIATRLQREDLDRALVSLGLAPSGAEAPTAAAALGLRGVRATPAQLLSAFVRLTAARPAGLREETYRVVMEGLRGAAEYGTARVFAERGIDALAKTGTAAAPGRGSVGLVVAVTPARRPTRAVVVVAPGATGSDAAAIAADRLNGTAAGGRLRIGRARPSGGYDEEWLELEDYVARVVAAEAPAGAGDEASRALAIVVRTFALANARRHSSDGFDLCSLTHCQVVGAATAASRRAAADTAGQVLRHEGGLATVYYGASCGGDTEKPSAVWPGASDAPYLVSRAEPECATTSRWSSSVSAPDLLRALRAAGRRGETIRSLAAIGRSPSGRVTRLAAEGLEPAGIGAEAFRLAVGRTLGWQVLRSTAFTVARTAEGYRFDGRGAGHGVGMCVTGAARMARAGRRQDEIIAAYFPGVRVDELGGEWLPSVEVTLPAGSERERQEVTGVAAGSAREFARRLALVPPAAFRLVFHPTVEAYSRATGQPWWTSAATRGDRVDLIPLAVLKQRGILEATLRHEIAHVLTADRLRGRPLWVREAVAMDLVGDGAIGTRAAPASCPTDGEMRRTASAEAMRTVYARAAACYSAQRAAGRNWDEVR